MSHHITDAERRRIEKFVATPKYERSPHILEPDEDDTEK